jgi:hypothetical protein
MSILVIWLSNRNHITPCGAAWQSNTAAGKEMVPVYGKRDSARIATLAERLPFPRRGREFADKKTGSERGGLRARGKSAKRDLIFINHNKKMKKILQIEQSRL